MKLFDEQRLWESVFAAAFVADMRDSMKSWSVTHAIRASSASEMSQLDYAKKYTSPVSAIQIANHAVGRLEDFHR